MVRIKHRYLLIQVLNPVSPASSTTVRSEKPSTATSNISENQTGVPSLLLPNPPPPHLLHIYAPTPDTFNGATMLRLVRAQLLLLFGEHGAAVGGAGLTIKYWSNATSTCILRCKREVVRMVWAAVTWVGGVKMPVGAGEAKGRGKGDSQSGREKERDVVMRVVRVSGTVRKCEEEAIRRARSLCGRVKGIGIAVEGGVEVGRGGGEAGFGIEEEGDQLEDASGVLLGTEDEAEDSEEEE